MGADQSSRANNDEPKLSQSDVRKLLNAQRQMYEKKCKQIVDKAQQAQTNQAVSVQHTIPMQQAYMPQQNHNIPMQQPNVPMQQPYVPMQQPNVPMQQPNVQVQQANVPKQQANVPMQQANVPMQRPNVPMQQVNVPMQKPNVPIQQPNTYIRQEDNIAFSQANTSMRQANISLHQSNTPMQQPNIPMQQPNVQLTKPNMSNQQSTLPPSYAMQYNAGTDNNSSGATVPIQSPENIPQGNASIERQRTPYRYGREELTNIRDSVASASTLYPNLNNPSGTVHTFDFNKGNTPPQDFVIVNREGQVERPQPSAPARQRCRDRSISRSRNKDVNNGFKCCACKEMFGLQIYQCNSGHSLCSICHASRRPCNNCGATSTNRRNFDLEKLVAEIKVPCPHEDDGCKLFIKAIDMDLHVKECPFKELQCPAGCSWKGQLKQLAGHFDASHPDRREADVDTEIRLHNISNNTSKFYLVLIGSYNFLFHVKVSDRNVYMTSQLIGTKISASKWSYEVHVYNKNESRRKYLYTDICNSHVERLDDIYKEGRCSLLPSTFASTFVNNGALTYKFYIKQTIENKPRGDNKKNQRGKGK